MQKLKCFILGMFCLLAVSGLFQLTGCGSVSMHADYPFYSNEQSLIDKADLIITGEVVKVNKAEKINIKSDRTSQGTNEDEKILYTVSEIKVVDVMKGNVKVGDIIKVKQLGDKNGAAEASLAKYDGYFKEKSQYVLFLSVYENPDSPFETLNPEQGQINIKDGKTKVNEINTLFKSGIPKDEFVAELKAKIDSKSK